MLNILISFVHSRVEQIKRIKHIFCLLHFCDSKNHEIDAFGVLSFGRPKHVLSLIFVLKELIEKLFVSFFITAFFFFVSFLSRLIFGISIFLFFWFIFLFLFFLLLRSEFIHWKRLKFPRSLFLYFKLKFGRKFKKIFLLFNCVHEYTLEQATIYGPLNLFFVAKSSDHF